MHEHTFGIISRLATLVFAGHELAHNPEWHATMVAYAQTGFTQVIRKIRKYPRALRPLASWFMPDCWEASRLVKKARQILAPLVAEREALRASSPKQGLPNDGLEWVRDAPSSHPWEPAAFQMALSVNAIHTTTDLAELTIYQLACHPELIAPLREEIVLAFGTHGLNKNALHELKLLDSVVKEAMRIKPTTSGTVPFF